MQKRRSTSGERHEADGERSIMSIVVVYKSLSGFTEKYARWIADELQAECTDIGSFEPGMVNEDTIIVFGGSLHAVGINGYKTLRKKLNNTEFRELVLFAVGASTAKPGIEDEIREANLRTEEEKNIRLFYMRGGFDYTKLGIWNRFLMTLLKWKIKSRKEEERTADEKGMLASFDKPLDATKRENINEIVDYVRSME